jgi:hypothetical protein
VCVCELTGLYIICSYFRAVDRRCVFSATRNRLAWLGLKVVRVIWIWSGRRRRRRGRHAAA